jgi:Tfp pilus assembly protein PilF
MLTAREGKNDLQVISAAEKAQDFFSVTDNNLVPLPWYSGMTYLRLNDNENALQQFKKAYSINPYNYNVLNNYAVLTYPDNPNLSEKLLNDALKINPAFDEGRKNLISLLIKKNNFAQAKAETERIQDTLLRKKLQSYILFIHQNN